MSTPLETLSGDAPGPSAFDCGSPFELYAKLDEKSDGSIEGFDHDANIVHPRKSHRMFSHA